MYHVRERLILHVEKEIDLSIVLIVEIIVKDLFVEEVMLTKTEYVYIVEIILKNFTFKNGNANGRNGKFVAA